jgi:hypothetical protein
VLLAHPQINVNQRDIIGSTPFLAGCRFGKVEVVKILLKDSHVDINMADDDGCTPLWKASYFGHVEVIKWMIASGRDINLDEKGKLNGNYFTAVELQEEGTRQKWYHYWRDSLRIKNKPDWKSERNLILLVIFLSGLF